MTRGNIEIAESGTFEVEYVIRKFVVDGEDAYDFISGPIESDDWYTSLEDARREAELSLRY